MNWYLIISLLLLTGAVLTILWYTRPRPRCPECGSPQVGQVSKEPLGMRDFDFGAGGGGGGYTMVQLTYQVTYRCNECRAQGSKTITETR
jgi:hypothetical protein